VNPYTGRRVVEEEVTRHILTLLLLAGCGAQSGEFAFKVGVPLKSTGKGALLMIVPQKFGACVLSTEVNEFEVSVLAKRFYVDLGTRFNIHVLEGTQNQKLAPTSYDFSTARTYGQTLLQCAESADLAGLRSYANSGHDLDFADYDKRTAAHLAAMNGHVCILSYLDDRGAQLDVQDAWGQRPIDEAKKHKHQDVLQFFQERQPRRQVRLGMRGSSKGGGSDAEDAMSGFDSQDNPAADLSEYANYR
jgi:glutaminase